MAEMDPETNQLLPARKRQQHRVRVQGRLAVVRSVSTVNLRPAASVLPSPVAAGGTTPTTPRFESGVAGSTVPPVNVRRRRSLDDASSDTEEEHDVKETAVRDRQFRGYGIGGAGNISGFNSDSVRHVNTMLTGISVQDDRPKSTVRRNPPHHYRSFLHSIPLGHPMAPTRSRGVCGRFLDAQGTEKEKGSHRNDTVQVHMESSTSRIC